MSVVFYGGEYGSDFSNWKFYYTWNFRNDYWQMTNNLTIKVYKSLYYVNGYKLCASER